MFHVPPSGKPWYTCGVYGIGCHVRESYVGPPMMRRRSFTIDATAALVGSATTLAASRAPGAQSPGAARGRVEFSALDFGAAGDGKTLDTKAIQAAIDACHAAGGGRVTVGPGVYMTGTLRLKSHVTLRIEAGARLAGSTNAADYPKDAGVCDWHPRFSWGREFTGTLVYGEKVEDVGIEGPGTIDGSQRPGNARTFPNPGDPESRRPMLVRLRDCTNVRLKDVILTNPASFTTFLVGCRDVLIDGVRVRSRETGNGDGLDFDGCERVRISNCDLVTGDDAIGLKTFQPNRPNRDFVITNCVISSTWAAVRLGPESFTEMQNIAVANCVFRDCRDGFKIQSCEGAVIERMVFSNIIMEGVLRPFFVTLNSFSMSKHAGAGPAPVGRLRDLHVSNVRAVVPRNPTGHAFDQPCVALVGLPGHSIEDVTFSDFNVRMPGGGTPEQAGRMEIPELLDRKMYPEAVHFGGELPASGIYLRHVRGFHLSQSRIATASPDARAFLAGDDLEDVSLSAVTAHGFDAAAGLVKFADARGVRLVNCSVRVGSETPGAGIQVEQARTDRPLVVQVTAAEEARLAGVRRK